MKKHAWMAGSQEEYAKLKLSGEKVEPWEDGIRTNGAKGSYEWWYFDSKLEDGSSLVIVFHTGPIASFQEGFVPSATFTLTKPDGETYDSQVNASVEDCHFGIEQCDVKIGACTFCGDLHEYEITWKDDEIEAKVQLTGNVPAWRPQTGHMLFGAGKLFAWLPAVPEGSVTVTIKKKDEEIHLKGTGYHDHNWGDVPMFFLMHHWYWGRAKDGDYQVVSSYITAGKKYSYDEIPIFMLAKNGQILAEQAEKYLTYKEEDLVFDPDTKKHVAGRLIYDYNDGTQHYRVTYQREHDLEKMGMETQVTKLQYVAIWLMGLRGSYHRMGGTVTVERFEKNELVETVSAPALWEQMYFGKDRI